MRIKTRRVLAVGTVVTAMSMVLAGCSSDPGPNRPENEIHIAVYGDSQNAAEQKIVDLFNKTSDVKAVLDKIPAENYTQKLQTIIDTPSAPDVFFNWGGGTIREYADADLLLPLDGFFEEDPAFKDMFLPSVLDATKVDGKTYGIPMRGTGPFFMFSNKAVLAEYNISEPKTWDELLAATAVLKDKGLIPISLGGAERWPTMKWFEYVYDRVAGPELFNGAVKGDKEVWASPESRESLKLIRQLVDSGAFGTNYNSVGQSDGAAPRLLRTGKAGFELMGSWYYAVQSAEDPKFAQDGLGYFDFPTIAGGAGNPENIIGNVNNFYSVTKQTRYPDAVKDFLKLMGSETFVKTQLEIGNLPTTTNTEKFLDTSASPDFLRFQFNLVRDAPSFQLSWDEQYPPEARTPMQTAVSEFFDGKIDADGFIKAMQAITG